MARAFLLLLLATFAPVSTAGSPTQGDESMLLQKRPPKGTSGNLEDDGDQDSNKYVYNPKEAKTAADSMPDVEGQAPPVPHWHACRFQAKAGGVYDLRPMMRLAATLEDDWVHKDATVSGVSYYLNICANTMQVPRACKKLAKKDPSPAYQIGSNGHCFYLGTLKTFKWKPIDSAVPSKGMILAYQNGERCTGGRTRQIKYTVTCSEAYGYEDGPLVVYETRGGCHYDVHWPNKAGCPTNTVIAGLNSWGPGSIFLVVLVLVLCVYVCGGCFYKRKAEGAQGIEACPHHTFWCALPAMFMGSFQFVSDKMSGANSSRAGFTRVPTTAGSSQYGASDTGTGISDDMF